MPLKYTIIHAFFLCALLIVSGLQDAIQVRATDEYVVTRIREHVATGVTPTIEELRKYRTENTNLFDFNVTDLLTMGLFVGNILFISFLYFRDPKEDDAT